MQGSIEPRVLHDQSFLRPSLFSQPSKVNQKDSFYRRHIELSKRESFSARGEISQCETMSIKDAKLPYTKDKSLLVDLMGYMAAITYLTSQLTMRLVQQWMSQVYTPGWDSLQLLITMPQNIIVSLH